MKSLGLETFHRLCDAGNGLEALRNQVSPGSDAWCALTELIQRIDAAVDLLVTSRGLGGEDDDATA